MSVIVLAAGCSGTAGQADPDLTALLPKINTAAFPPALNLEFDFGPIVARGQTLRHAFTLTNPTNSPIRLTRASALTPCCSAITKLPEEIPSGGTAKVEAVLSPGHQSGWKRAEFEIETDARDQPVRRLALLTQLFSECAIETVEGFDASLPLNVPGKQIVRVVCLRKGSEGRAAPVSVNAALPLHAVLRDTEGERERPGGLIESSRLVEVKLPPLSEAGPKRNELIFHWSDGYTMGHVVAWEVRRSIVTKPSGLVVKRTAGTLKSTIVIAADDRPFRLLKMSGPGTAAEFVLPTRPEKRHSLSIVIDPSKLADRSTSDVEFLTDHPDQPTVTVSVLVLAADREGTP